MGDLETGSLTLRDAFQLLDRAPTIEHRLGAADVLFRKPDGPVRRSGSIPKAHGTEDVDGRVLLTGEEVRSLLNAIERR